MKGLESSTSSSAPDGRFIFHPKATLYAWRSRNLGPPGIRVGNALRYRRGDVEAWLDEHTDDRAA